jgi:hypothetical protein
MVTIIPNYLLSVSSIREQKIKPSLGILSEFLRPSSDGTLGAALHAMGGPLAVLSPFQLSTLSREDVSLATSNREEMAKKEFSSRSLNLTKAPAGTQMSAAVFGVVLPWPDLTSSDWKPKLASGVKQQLAHQVQVWREHNPLVSPQSFHIQQLIPLHFPKNSQGLLRYSADQLSSHLRLLESRIGQLSPNAIGCVGFINGVTQGEMIVPWHSFGGGLAINGPSDFAQLLLDSSHFHELLIKGTSNPIFERLSNNPLAQIYLSEGLVSRNGLLATVFMSPSGDNSMPTILPPPAQVTHFLSYVFDKLEGNTNFLRMIFDSLQMMRKLGILPSWHNLMHEVLGVEFNDGVSQKLFGFNGLTLTKEAFGHKVSTSLRNRCING